jgi:hypothetical protein
MLPGESSMPAVRLSFLVAGLATLVHGVAGFPSGGELALVARNLVFWQLISALFGGLLAIISWWTIGRRARTLALAIAPTILVGLEISAWLVTENFHHTLGPWPRLFAFAFAWILPAAAFLVWGRFNPRLRWMTPVQTSLVAVCLVMVLTLRPDGDDPADRPDLALFVLDAVQVRALGHMGAPMDPSPRLDALAAEGWTSDAAFSSATTSVPGHAAILFGLDVAEHRAPTNEFNLPQDLPASLAERLQERGYTTMGFCHNPLVSAKGGFARGFEVWWNWGEKTWLQNPPAVALLHWPAAYLWLRASHRDLVTLGAKAALPSAKGPLFTFVQLLYTHDSYVDGDDWVNADRVAHMRRLLNDGTISNRTSHDPDEVAWLHTSYLAAVAYSDRLVGEMIDQLRARAGERGLVVAITADHGENLTEHTDAAVAKHFGPWSTSLRMPLSVADTRVATGGVRGTGLSSHQRLERVFLDAADQRLPLEAEAWIERVERDLGIDPAFIYSEPWLVLVDDSLKVAIDRTDLAAPPLAHRWRLDFEDRNPVDSFPIIDLRWEELLQMHERMREAGLFDAPPDLDPEKLEHLRALGYIE